MTSYTKTTQVTDGMDTITYTGEAVTLLVHTSGLILNIEVDTDRQGEGLARAIYDYADADLRTGLYHVPSWGRTEDGNAFAQAMGGEVMDDKEAAAIVGMDLSIYDAA